MNPVEAREGTNDGAHVLAQRGAQGADDAN